MASRTSLTFVNGQPLEVVSVLDRGFNYGDGVFETMRGLNNRLPYWQWHRQRLQQSCARLQITINIHQVDQYIAMALEQSQTNLHGDHGQRHVMVKLVITRGVSLRGYRPQEGSLPAVVITVDSCSPPQPHDGIAVILCKHRLPINPVLAGIKHLNRLDNVMASLELENRQVKSGQVEHSRFEEGLLFDQQGHLIEGISRNVFVVIDGELQTPKLHQAGVAGVMRRVILEKYAAALNLAAKESALSEQDLYRASEVFLCNSVNGIWPIAKIGDRPLVVGSVSRALQQAWLSDWMEQAQR